jgi:hypothetical protein
MQIPRPSSEKELKTEMSILIEQAFFNGIIMGAVGEIGVALIDPSVGSLDRQREIYSPKPIR